MLNSTAQSAGNLALPGSDLGGAAMSMAGGLFLILGLLFLGFYLLKRFGPRAGLGSLARTGLKIEGQQALGPKRHLVVVRFLNKRLLLGVTEHQINLVTELDAGNDDAQSDFSQSLEKARAKGDSS